MTMTKDGLMRPEGTQHLATSNETAVVEDLIERIGLSETLNLLAAVCVVHGADYGEGLTAKRYRALGERISDLADDCTGF